MRRIAIPTAPGPFPEAVKANLDRITGQQRNLPPLPLLPETATLAEVVAAYNALVQRIQGVE